MGAPKGGIQNVPAGTTDASPALAPDGATTIATTYPDMAVMAARGWAFTATQAAAGVAPGTSATTTTPGFTLWFSLANLAGLFIYDVSWGYVSGTIGAGHIMYGEVAATTAPSGGTAITAYSMKDGTAVSGLSVGTGHTTTAMSASTDRFVCGNLYATLATAPSAGVGAGIEPAYRAPVNRWIPASTAACFYGVSAAGSTPLVRTTVRGIAVPTGYQIPT